MKALNIGVIGLGNIGQKHCDALRQIRQANVVAVSDINVPVLDKTAASLNAAPYADYKKLLEHPGLEAVIVALPDQLHRDPVVLAAQAGKHVLVEKPIATTETDAKEMMQAAEENGVKLMVGFTLHFIPHYLQARNAVGENRLAFARQLFLGVEPVQQIGRIEAPAETAGAAGQHA